MKDSLISRYRTEIMGFSAVFIMLFHFFPCLYKDMHIPVLTALFSRGNIGVDAFLFLSGMGLFCSLTKDSRTLPFYRKRISRVVIPALAISLPYWIATDFLFKHTSAGMFLLDWTGISFWTLGNGTVWYVSLIVVLYLVYPVIFRMQKKHFAWTVLLMSACFAAVTAVCLLLPEQFEKLEAALTRIPVFLAGSLFGGMLLGEQAEQMHIKRLLTGFTILMLCVFAAAFLIPSKHENFVTLLYRFGSGGAAILGSMLLSHLLARSKPAAVLYCLKKLGMVSLELYLIHIFIKNVLTVTRIGAKSGLAVQLLVIAAGMTASVLLTLGVAMLENRIRAGHSAKPKS